MLVQPILFLAILFLAMLAVGCLAILAFVVFIPKPGRSIVPLYAATLPIASAVDLPIPLPPPFNSLSSLIGALAIGACLGHIIVYRRGTIPTVPVAVWLLLLAWTTVGVFWADNAQKSFNTIVVAIPLVLLMALVSALPRDSIDFDLLRGAIILSGLIVGAYGLSILTVGAQLPTHAFGQRFSISGNPTQTNPNILAATLLLPLVMSLERMIMGKGGWRVFAAASTLFTMFAIFLTASRGGIISAGIAIMLTILFCRRAPGGRTLVSRTFVQAAVFSAGVVLLMLLAATLGPARTMGRLEARFISAPLDRLRRTEGDSSGRFEIWQAGLVACRIHCALGVGPGNFPDAYNEVSAFSRARRYVGPNRPAHNIILSLAVETGFVGLSLFALAVGTEWLSLSQPRMRSLSPGLRAGLLGLLAANFFLSLLWYKYIWLIFTLIRAAEASSSSDPAEEQLVLLANEGSSQARSAQSYAR